MKKFLTLFCLLVLATNLRAQENKPSALEQVAKEQQKSIAQLVYALKEVRKSIPPKGEKQCDKKENPFKDKQEFKETPPANQLQDLKKQQQEIIEQLKKDAKQEGEGSAGKSSGSAGKQQQISAALNKLSNNTNLNPAVRQAIKEAEDASDQTAAAMKAAAHTEAQVGAEKTLAKISKALEEQQTDARKQAEATLDKAAQELAEAEQARKNMDGEKAGNRAEEALMTLEDAAQQQKQSGSKAMSKKLAEIAKKMRADELSDALTTKPGDQDTADKLAEAREAVAKARQGDKTAREEMKAATQALKELKKEMQYRAKTPKELTDPQLAEMAKQCSGQGQRIARAQGQMSLGKGQKAGEEGPKNEPYSVKTDTEKLEELAASIEDGKEKPPKEHLLIDLIDLSERILIKAQQHLDALEQETIVRNISKDEVPEKYKDDVATYFKRLSEPERK